MFKLKIAVFLLVFFTLNFVGVFAEVPHNGIHVICRNIHKRRNWQRAVAQILDLDYIGGLLLYISWKEFEPEPGKYRWKMLDDPLKLAAARGKTIAFGIRVCARAPEWVKQQVETFNYIHMHPSIGKVVAPVPWSPEYLKLHDRMVAALGKRYNGNPALHYVTITGPSSLFGVEVNFPLKNFSTKEDCRKLNYSDAKFIKGWKHSMDVFDAAFPNTLLSLGLHRHIDLENNGKVSHHCADRADSICRQIRDYCIKKQAMKNKKVVLRLLGLGRANKNYFPGPYKDNNSLSPYLRLIWDVKKQAYIGFEANRVFSRPNVGMPQGLPEKIFTRILQNGISYKPNWIEIKEFDILDLKTGKPFEPYVPALKNAFLNFH